MPKYRVSPVSEVARAAILSLMLVACTDARTPSDILTDGRDVENVEIAGKNALRVPVSSYTAEIPLAYYELSLAFSKRTAGVTPPVQARAFGYMGLALYEALVGGMADHQSVASQLNGIGALPAPAAAPYHWPLVANAALSEVMRGLWGGSTNRAAENTADLHALEASFEAQYSGGFPPGRARKSVEFGRAVGAAVFQTSKDDGGHEAYLTSFPAYDPPVGPGLWVPTAPGQRAVQPYWGGTVMTLAVSSAAECDQGGPPAYSETPGSEFYNEALEVYELASDLTPEQLTIARFWADGPGTISGPGHALAITSQILVQEGANLAIAAETYARVGIADADALTSLWWSKYHYNLLRPITYIQSVIDSDWTPVLPTPSFPEYTSAHSAQSAAVATSLEYMFGTNVAFVDHAHDADGFDSRPFNSIYAAAEEAGISRIYAGIHFRSGNLHGQALGRCVAAKVHDLSWHR
jgi:hypothetical protein